MRSEAKAETEALSTVTLWLDALTDLPMGIVKLTKQGNIVFANQEFCRILGIDSYDGLDLAAIFPDEENYSKVKPNLESRFTHRAGNEYCAEVTRPRDGKKIPISIIAVPEMNESNEVIGSFTLVRNMAVDTAIHEIHKVTETERDWQKLLEKSARQLGELIDFDWLAISVYSKNLHHTRVLSSYSEGDAPQFNFRWYQLPLIGLKMIEKKEPIIVDDFDEFLAGDEWREVRDDIDTRNFLEQGFKSCVWYPILEGDLVASLAMYSKKSGAYGQSDVNILNRLPTRRAVSMALHYINRQENDFRLELMGKFAATDMNIEKAAKLLVDRISAHYEWNHVALFRVNEEAGRFELIAQSYSSKEYEIQDTFHQDIGRGILGHVYQTRQFVNLGDIRAHPELGPRWEPAVSAKIVSELAIPIVVNGKVCAILNSEDSLVNAYSDEERRDLEVILKEVSGIYQRMELQQVLSAIQDSTRDIIIRTDSHAVIRQVNPASLQLLGYDEAADMVGTPLADYFHDPEFAAGFLSAENRPGDQVRLVRKDRTPIDVLMSASTLPDKVGGRVYTASDMSWRKRVEKLEFMDDMYREIGEQSHGPLSLCFSWLRQMSRSCSESDRKAIEKIFTQLKKVQITFDRLSLFEREGTTMPYHPIPLQIPYILRGVTDEFPQGERSHVELALEKDLPMVDGDLFQLSFCFKSVLSYLLGLVPEDGKVRVEARQDDGRVRVTIKGKTPTGKIRDVGKYTDESWVSHLLFELTVAGEAMHDFMEQHGGHFEESQRIGDDEQFGFVLPAKPD